MIAIIFCFFKNYNALDFIEGSFNNICYEFEAEIFKDEKGIRNTDYIEKYGFNFKTICDDDIRSKLINNVLFKIYGSQFDIESEYLCIEYSLDEGEDDNGEQIEYKLINKIKKYGDKYEEVENTMAEFKDFGLKVSKLNLNDIFVNSLKKSAENNAYTLHSSFFKTDILKDCLNSRDFFEDIKKICDKELFFHRPTILIFHNFVDEFGFHDKKEEFIREKMEEYDIQYSLSCQSFYPNSDSLTKYTYNTRRDYACETAHEPLKINLINDLKLMKLNDYNLQYFILFDKVWNFEITGPMYKYLIHFRLSSFDIFFNIRIHNLEFVESRLNTSFHLRIRDDERLKYGIIQSYRVDKVVLFRENVEINDIKNLNFYDVDIYRATEHKRLKKICKDTLKMVERVKQTGDIDLGSFFTNLYA